MPHASHSPPCRLLRIRWSVAGQVQGVGYRPFIHRTANDLRLTGTVRNTPAGVVIEAQGTDAQLRAFERTLHAQSPPAARVERITRQEIDLETGEESFQVIDSAEEGDISAGVVPDLAVCHDCLREISHKADPRRYRHGLINCTHCGPRYTILRRIPYDRANTTMAPFAMCDACQAEYHDPADRRFHAQPTNCHDCGPALRLIDCRLVDEPGADRAPAGDPIAAAARVLAEGRIVAIKGLGGFHLACRADREDVVARLRSAKRRLWKPFAIMCARLEVADRLVELTDAGRRALVSPAAPIVLAPRKTGPIAPSVAPDSPRLGVMLPYTPIQHLLFADGAFDALVMTSANDADEPLVFEDDQVIERLAPLCDAILTHERAIERPVDDSVLLARRDGSITFVRRARGYVPSPIHLPMAGEPGLCLGADLKSAVAVVRGDEAILSQHLGDMQHARGYALLKRTARDLMKLLAVRPRWIAHDLHPAYFSTRAARELAEELGVPRIAVQHHHAHAAAVLAEHGHTGPALAIVCDGTGYGTDGAIWGGELLKIDDATFERLAHVAPMPLPGGDSAARQPWRSALAVLTRAYGPHIPRPAIEALRAFAPLQDIDFVRAMLSAGTACTQTSSTGRLFDAFAALLGLAGENHYEGYAPSRLEAAATEASAIEEQELVEIVGGRLDPSPLVRWVVKRIDRPEERGTAAWVIHDQLAAAWARVTIDAARACDIDTIALSGGVFVNELFSRRLEGWLADAGLRVLRHEQAPPNDGGIALGQALVAAARAAAGEFDVSQ